ncbi:MAG TPA: prepilin-type N-terminal cleavage/methylation domain-containing protein [Nitrospirae bacterium]|nr:prepilin-type N-terminal cleavage/methylation domain-containing protein [Nitrospirota bacterium]
MKDHKNIYPAAVSSCKGFTLIEVLVSVTILAIGLLGVAMMQVSSISGNTFSREMAVATELGQDLIEKLNSSTYTSLVEDPALLAGTHPTTVDVTNGWAVGAGSANITDERGQTVGPLLYTRTWTVTDPAAGTFGVGTNIKTITVTVTWNDNIGTLPHTVTMDGVRVRG